MERIRVWVLVTIAALVVLSFVTFRIVVEIFNHRKLKFARALYAESMTKFRFEDLFKDWSDIEQMLPDTPSTIVRTHCVRDAAPIVWTYHRYTCWVPDNLLEKFERNTGKPAQTSDGTLEPEFEKWIFKIFDVGSDLKFWVTEFPEPYRFAPKDELKEFIESEYGANAPRVIEVP